MASRLRLSRSQLVRRQYDEQAAHRGQARIRPGEAAEIRKAHAAGQFHACRDTRFDVESAPWRAGASRRLNVSIAQPASNRHGAASSLAKVPGEHLPV